MSLRVAIGPSSFGEADPEPLHALHRAGIAIVPNPFGRRLTEEEVIAHVVDVDGLVAGLEPLTRRVFETAPRLRALARVGIGIDNVDQAAARELGVRVSNTPDEPAAAVAEMTVAALLAIVRELVPANEALHRGEWKKRIGDGLAGATALLVGYGRVGRRVGTLLRTLGVTLLVTDPALSPGDCTDGEMVVSLTEGLTRADVVSLHAAGRTVVMDATAFGSVREGVVLLNSARGELVDEAALCAALDDGRVRAAWFDVFREEPYTGVLTKYPQVLLTPHIATYTRQCRRDMELAAVRNLLRDLGVA